MKIKWLGHASFLITAQDGTTVITDPYGKFDGLNYEPITESADIAVISHQHGDHYGGNVGGNPQEVTRSGTTTVKGIEFKGIATHHDKSGGKERGDNIIFCFVIDGIRLCHLGDLGHLLSEEQVSQIGKVDIMFVPVGGFFTVDAGEATEVCNQINPAVIIPMHVRNQKCNFPIANVDDFIRDKENVEKVGGSEKEFDSSTLPGGSRIIVFDPAK